MRNQVALLLVLVPLLGGCPGPRDESPLTIESLSYAPVGNQIAFVTVGRDWMTGEAWVTTRGSPQTAPTLLLEGASWSAAPLAWRHDAQALAIGGAPEGVNGLWLVPVGPSGTARLLMSAEDCDSPVWSPDDEQLAWVDSGEGRDSRLLVMRVADGYVREVRTTSAEPVFPQWNLDGSWIAFYGTGTTLHNGSRDSSIYVVSPDGSTEKRLDVESSGFVWAGNEELLYSLSSRRKNASGDFVTWKLNIWVTDVATGKQRRVLATTALPEKVWRGRAAPALSPDKRHLLLLGGSNMDEEGDIYRIDLDRGDVTQLTSGRTDSWPCWSGDGHTIAFVRERTSIWTMTANGAEQTKLLDVWDLPR